MITKLLEEGSSQCPNFDNQKSSEKHYKFRQAILNSLRIVILALLLPFTASAQGLDQPPQLALDNVPEASDFGLLYQVDIPENACWTDGVPYAVDNSNSSLDCFEKVAYFVRKGDRWIWVSMDAFTTDLDQLGLPQKDGIDFIHQQVVDNLSVVSSNSSLNRENVATGNLEIWNYGYETANGLGLPSANTNTFDYDDTVNTNAPFNYSSFQVHDHGAGEVLFAYNGWGTCDAPFDEFDDLGIGNNIGDNTDYTFENNTGEAQTRRLYILVGGSPDYCQCEIECTLIASEEIHLHGDNNVISGDVCVTDSDGEIKLHDNTHVSGSINAADFDVDDDSSAGSMDMNPSNVELPPFYFNPFCDDASIEVKVEEEDDVILDGQIYKKVEIKEGGQVTFTNPNVFICELKTEKGTIINFEDCANLFIKKVLEFNEMTTFNAAGNNVTIYAMDNVKVKKGSNITAHIYTDNKEIVAEGDDNKPTYMKGLFIGKKIKGDKNVTWEGDPNCDPCPVDIPTTTANCDCKGGMTSVNFEYVGGAGADITSNSGTVTDNGDGTYTIYDNGEKLEKNLEIYVDGNTAEVHTSCSQDILGVTFAGSVTIIGYTDTEGNISSVDGCESVPGPDCECNGGLTSVTFSYSGELADLGTNSGTIADNGDGTFTVSNNGVKLEKDLEISSNGNTAEIHTSCSQDILGVTFSGGITVVGYVDTEGSVTSIETCPVTVECDCSGGLIEVTFEYTGEGIPSTNSGIVTDNGDGTYTVYDNGVKLEKDLEITVAGGVAEIHTSCSQDILGVTFAGGVKVIGHVDTNGNVCTISSSSRSTSRSGAENENTNDKEEVAVDEIQDVISGFNVKAWPIPSDNAFNIRVASDNRNDKVAIQVMDITGKLVHADSFDANKLYQFGTKLQSGIYFVRIKQGNNLQIKRVVKH